MASSCFHLEAMVRGYHVYCNVWQASRNEILQCTRDVSNRKDPYAVSVVKSGTGIVGHLPKKISTACSLFLRRGGSITCKVTGTRRYSSDLPQGGVEIPCSLELTGSLEDVKRAEILCRAALNLPVTQEQATAPWSDREQNIVKRKPEIEEQAEDVCSKKLKTSLSTTADKTEDIIMGRKLSDVHIGFAQDLLKSQFENINGLECTLLQSKNSLLTEHTAVNRLQIFHDRGDHWITASNMNVEPGLVVVYDSVYCRLDPVTKDAIVKKFQFDSSKPPDVKLVKFGKQKGSSDCGLFAIAAATAAAFGQEPSTLKFIQEKMRTHLVTCFQNQKMSPFPTLEK